MPPLISYSPQKTGVAFQGLVSSGFVLRNKLLSSVSQMRFFQGRFIIWQFVTTPVTRGELVHMYDPTQAYPARVGTNALSQICYGMENNGNVLMAFANNDANQDVTSIVISNDLGATFTGKGVGTTGQYKGLAFTVAQDNAAPTWLGTCSTINSTPGQKSIIRTTNDGGTIFNVSNNTGAQGMDYMAGGNGVHIGILSSSRRVMRTTNGGNTWTAVNFAAASNNVFRVKFVNGHFFITQNGVNGPQISISTDGLNWTHHNVANGQNTYFDVCYGNGMYIIVGNGSNAYAFSVDGCVTWQIGAFPNAFRANMCEYGNGHFVFMMYSANQQNTYMTYAFS